MNSAQDALQAVIDKMTSLDVSAANFLREADALAAAAGSASETTPAFKAIQKLGKGATQVLLDCALITGLAFNLQRRLLAVMQPEWKNSPRGQARAHEYVDLWGRSMSLQALCQALLSDADAGMASNQIRARLEALLEGTTQNILQTSQALMAAGEVEVAARSAQYALSKLKAAPANELRGSILKELQGLS